MKKILLFILLITLAFALPSQSAQLLWRNCLTGGGDCLDGIDGNDLADGDGAIVILDNSGTYEGYLYRLEDTAETESSPNVISPDSNAGNKRWRLVNIHAIGFVGPLTGAVTGNASTATALAANPDACAAGSYVSDIAANGTLTCANPLDTPTFILADDSTMTFPTALPTTSTEGIMVTADDGTSRFIESASNCFLGGSGTGETFACTVLADVWSLMWTQAITDTAQANQLVCFDDAVTTTKRFKSCGAPTTYTEPAGALKAICDTGTNTTGACDPTAHPGGFSTIEVGHASDTTVARASAGVISVEGLSIPRIVASGSTEVNFAEIASTACEVIQISATNTADTDVIIWNPKTAIMGASGDTPAGTTGFVPATTGGLSLIVYPSSGYVNVKACNWSTGALNAGAFYVNWKVLR